MNWSWNTSCNEKKHFVRWHSRTVRWSADWPDRRHRSNGRNQLEDRIASQHIVGHSGHVVGEDAIDPGASHLQEGVADIAAVPSVSEGLGELLCQPNCSSSCRRNASSPPSLESCAVEGSTTTG